MTRHAVSLLALAALITLMATSVHVLLVQAFSGVGAAL